ncbi:MAG: hypothetical protein PHE89_03520 [Alphaproteobacteria bacterium]|nr:hypothetical protein [Alphaproteobacteria bacterium]
MEKVHSLQKIKQCEAAMIEYFNSWDGKKDWDSSAEKLDRQLQEKGHRTSYKFSQQYRFPKDQTNAEYEAYINQKYKFYFNVNRGNIKKFEQAEEGSLLAATKVHILQKIPLKKTQIAKDLQKLQELNPEVSEINVDQDSFDKMFFALNGIVYNYKPQDINAFLESLESRKNPSFSFNEKMKHREGINITFILSEEHQQKLSEIVNVKSQQRSYEGFMNFQQQRGHFND